VEVISKDLIFMYRLAEEYVSFDAFGFRRRFLNEKTEKMSL